MASCSYCKYDIEGEPKYCPNCGKVNYDAVMINMLDIRERINSGKATQEDYDFVNTVKRDTERVKPIDYRTPFEQFLDWWGWWVILPFTVWVSVNGYLSEFWTGLLFSLAILIFGLIIFRKGARRRGELVAIFFVIGGIVGIGYSIWLGMKSLFGF